MLKRLGYSSFVCVLLVLLQAAVAQAASPPPSFNDNFLGTVVHVYPHCNADGSGQVYWSVSGTAYGSYNGVFYEAGVAQYQPIGTGSYFGHTDFSKITSIQAAFFVNSVAPAAQIGGTKQISLGGSAVGRCAYADLTFVEAIDTSVISNDLSWQAYIHPSGDGTYRDSGTSIIFITRHDLLVNPTPPYGLGSTFFEELNSTQAAPVPVSSDFGGGDD